MIMNQQPQQLRIIHGQAQFPACVSEILCQITSFIRSHSNNIKNWDRIKGQKDLQRRIDADLFCLSSDRRTSRLTPIQQFKLLGIVCTYFFKEVSKEQNPQRYHYFDVIFCGREGEALLHEFRINFLTKLCILALQYPVYGLFEDISQWLNKMSSGKARDYADRLIGDIVDNYVLIPPQYNMHEYVLPLNLHSLEFVVYFVTFSIKERTLGPALAEIIGEWLSNGVEAFLRITSQNSHLLDVFRSEKFDLLLLYDFQNIHSDEIHHRFHFIVTSMIIHWNQHIGAHRPVLLQLLSFLQRDDLSKVQIESVTRERIYDNLNNCLHANFLPNSYEINFITTLKNSLI